MGKNYVAMVYKLKHNGSNLSTYFILLVHIKYSNSAFGKNEKNVIICMILYIWNYAVKISTNKKSIIMLAKGMLEH